MIKVSRSGVEKFLTCKRCFVLEQKYKVRAPSLPFTLNIAVDNLCKNEFDYYREIQEPHPIFLEHKIDAKYFMIGVGMWLGLIMAFNVWVIIWPNQKKALGIVSVGADEKASAAKKAMLFSRTNTLLSIPMLYCMVGAQNLY